MAQVSADTKGSKQVLRDTCLHILNNGGVVREMKALGAVKRLPYRMKRHQVIHNEGA